MAKVVSSDNLDEVKLLGITALPALYHEKRIIDGCDEIIEFFKEAFAAQAQQKKHMTGSDPHSGHVAAVASRAPMDEFDLKETMSRMADTHEDNDDEDAPSSSDLDSKYRAALKMRKITPEQVSGKHSQDSKAVERAQDPPKAHEREPAKPPIVPEDNDDQLMLDKFYSDI